VSPPNGTTGGQTTGRRRILLVLLIIYVGRTSGVNIPNSPAKPALIASACRGRSAQDDCILHSPHDAVESDRNARKCRSSGLG
jgi:hypothetical protein